MRKISLTVIFILILTTSLVKNSTKEIEDKIFTVNENIRSLKTEFGNVMLEYNYLSSPEKLIQLQSKYFENDLIKVDIIDVKKIIIKNDILELTDFINKAEANE